MFCQCRRDPIKSHRTEIQRRQFTQRSLPGLTQKSGVPDFGALNIAKVGNIRLWLQSIPSQKEIF
jgi:hypothetical protein